ncbi:hypothetical protein L596_026059 [Steinernema carpocapsae]|uniref:Uncharacterized protein n=1 Tax=Steinernema carpocapsae TaxID=34508 RepID=A0A4U5M0A8_STECR|nr:hypothetical protein L596_026059 [Steinernema carpocapsae]
MDYFLYNLYSHAFHTTSPDNVAVIDVMLGITISCFALASVMYFAAFWSVFHTNRLIKAQERSLLVQATLPFLWLIVTRAVSSLVQLIKDDANAYIYTIFFNLIMRSLPIAHVVVYLACNRTFRQSLLGLIRSNKVSSLQVVRTVSRSSRIS